jgi:hypothetical protein
MKKSFSKQKNHMMRIIAMLLVMVMLPSFALSALAGGEAESSDTTPDTTVLSTINEEPVVEEPVVEEPVVEEPVVEEPVVEEPVVEEPVVEEPVVEEPVVEEPVVEEPVVEEPVVEEPVVEEPVVEEPVVEESVVEEPAVEETPVHVEEEEELGIPLYQILDEQFPDRRITIYANWGDKDYIVAGDKVRLTAKLEGYEGLVYSIKWQYSLDGQEDWQDVENGDGRTYTFEVNEFNFTWYWRAVVTVSGVEE